MEQVERNYKFSANSNFFKLFWVFTVFSFLGTISEGFYWIFRYGHFAWRTGLIYGPFSEIYGMAAVLMILLLNRYQQKSPLFIFIAAYLISVSFELASSLIQQWMFGYTSWDYSTSKFAILGRAHLIYAIPWAGFGVLLIKIVYPWMCRILSNIPKKTGAVITWLLLIFMILNILISAAAVYRYDQRQHNIPATHFIQQELDRHYPDGFLESRFARLDKGRS